ncbi:MAG: uroporphyrinogen decarboxylase [bacterium]|nr:uroporphyrinogen decarboxylase [bacterium]
MLSLERFKKACNFEPVDRPPVWMMRQAGRTLPEYLAVREKYSFKEVAETPELATEVTLQPLRRFPVDAAIIFSDILVIPDAMDMEVAYSPKLSILPPLKDAADVHNLKLSGLTTRLDYVAQLIRSVKKEVGKEKAVLGFSGAPFTLACYMTEGGSSKNFLAVREMMYHHPQLLEELLDKLTIAVTEYLTMQMEENVNAVQLFDTWAGHLNPVDYDRFVLPYVSKIISNLKGKGIPVIYYINGIGNLLQRASDSGADIIGVDWRLDLSEVREKLGPETVVQGNLDPALLFAPPEDIRSRVHAMLKMTGGRGHIANLGHGLIPSTPIKGIEAFVNAVTQWQPEG